MRIIDQNGCDYPYESIAISYGDGIIYARPISNMDKRYLIAQYSTQDKAKKAMQMLHEAHTGAPFIMKNVEVPVGFAEQLKNMRSGFITIADHGDNVRVEPMNIVFRFPSEDEIWQMVRKSEA